MAKTENLYLFEIKHPIVVESNCSLITGGFYKVVNPARLEWLREWEYLEMLLDLVLFTCS